MVFIWRGFGLIVPIVFGICAWIVSYWFEDTRLGNGAYMGWTTFYTAIVLLLPGLAMFNDKDDEDGTKRYHDFMFVPILFWSLGLGALCTYLLITSDPQPGDDENTSAQTEQTDEPAPKEEKAFRIVNFLNSSNDTLNCIIKTEHGSEKVTVEPKSWVPMELVVDSYTFVVNDMNGNKLATYSSDKLKEPTSSQVDYESGWVQLDNGAHKLVLVDVTPMMPADFKASNLKDHDWTKRVAGVYDGKSFMEPKVPKDAMYNSRVLEPGSVLPAKVGTDEQVFALITVTAEKEITNEYLIERFKELYFE